MTLASNREDMERMISAYLDGELTQAEHQRVRILLEDSAEYRQVYDEMRKLQNITREMPLPNPSEDRITQIEQALAVQAPRRLGWLLILAGVAAWLIYALVMFIRNFHPPTPAELIAGAIVIGFITLFISVLVQRIYEYPHDRYKGVKR
jgi:anti-sigma factor RsiW